MHPIHPQSLLSILDLSLEDISNLLTLTSTLEQTPPGDRSQILRGRTVALLFYESSTRTRTSFELAAKQLGATTTLVSDKSSSIEKGESLKDTGLTLRALGAEAIILRHNTSGAPWLLARATGLPVLNAGDGTHEHPSQALLDLRTILQRLNILPTSACHPERSAGRGVEGPAASSSAAERSSASAFRLTPQTLAGRTVTITGDILHSRVARSNALLLPRLGARVLLCGPEPLLPETFSQILPQFPPTTDPGTPTTGPGAPGSAASSPDLGSSGDLSRQPTGTLEITRDFDQAIAQSDVLMQLRIQSERLANLDLDLADYTAHYQLNADRLRAAKPDAIVLHPGPMIRGLEITSDVADSPQSAIEQQVTNGLGIRAALLTRALTPPTSV